MKDLTDYIKMREQMMISLGGDFQESERDSREKIIQGGSMDRLDYLNDLEIEDWGYDRIRKKSRKI